MLRFVLCAAAITITQGLAEPVLPAPEDVVLVVRGVCDVKNSLRTDDCTVTLRRGEFDTLISIVSPGREVTPAMRNRFAKT